MKKTDSERKFSDSFVKSMSLSSQGVNTRTHGQWLKITKTFSAHCTDSWMWNFFVNFISQLAKFIWSWRRSNFWQRIFEIKFHTNWIVRKKFFMVLKYLVFPEKQRKCEGQADSLAVVLSIACVVHMFNVKDITFSENWLLFQKDQ